MKESYNLQDGAQKSSNGRLFSQIELSEQELNAIEELKDLFRERIALSRAHDSCTVSSNIEKENIIKEKEEKERLTIVRTHAHTREAQPEPQPFNSFSQFDEYEWNKAVALWCSHIKDTSDMAMHRTSERLHEIVGNDVYQALRVVKAAMQYGWRNLYPLRAKNLKNGNEWADFLNKSKRG